MHRAGPHAPARSHHRTAAVARAAGGSLPTAGAVGSAAQEETPKKDHSHDEDDSGRDCYDGPDSIYPAGLTGAIGDGRLCRRSRRLAGLICLRHAE